MTTGPDVARFDAWPEDEARRRLLTCLDVPRWADEVVAGRPYTDLGALEDRMTAVAATVTDDELARALARHPRIGERADASRHEAAHSAREQSGVDRGDADLLRALEEANHAYEERFDRVFIIRAAGRTGRDVLDELARRLDNTPAAERTETVGQLAQIAVLRLREALSSEEST